MGAREEMEVTAEFEVNVDLYLQEAEPVSEEILDLHSDQLTDALERGAAELALGLVVSLDIPKSTIGLLFDVLGDSETQIYEKLAEVIRVIEREPGLSLLVVKTEVRPITEADWADLTRFLERCKAAA